MICTEMFFFYNHRVDDLYRNVLFYNHRLDDLYINTCFDLITYINCTNTCRRSAGFANCVNVSLFYFGFSKCLVDGYSPMNSAEGTKPSGPKVSFIDFTQIVKTFELSTCIDVTFLLRKLFRSGSWYLSTTPWQECASNIKRLTSIVESFTMS